MVSAWACANGTTLGQVKVGDKSNEITAIPALVKALDLSECIVTIDAMGCHKEIVKAIVEKGADYVICLKDNQKRMRQWVSEVFEDIDAPGKHTPETMHAVYTTEERKHGRIEKRVYDMFNTGCNLYRGWENLNSFVRVHSYRKETASGKESEETRYYIFSIGLDIEKIANAIRGHWSVENNLHWQMDVLFNEDATRKRNNAAVNFSLANKIALAAINRNTDKGSVKGKRKRTGWDDSFLEQLLNGEF